MNMAASASVAGSGGGESNAPCWPRCFRLKVRTREPPRPSGQASADAVVITETPTVTHMAGHMTGCYWFPATRGGRVSVSKSLSCRTAKFCCSREATTTRCATTDRNVRVKCARVALKRYLLSVYYMAPCSCQVSLCYWRAVFRLPRRIP